MTILSRTSAPTRVLATAVLAIACAAMAPTRASAIVINDADAAQAAAVAAPFVDRVARVEIPLDSGGTGVCTGTPISPTHVLTADHCFYDADGTLRTNDPFVRFYDGNGVRTTNRQGISVTRFGPPSNNIDAPLLDGTDLAVIELASALPERNEPFLLLWEPLDIIGSEGTLLGYGRAGVGSTGAQGGVSSTLRGATQAIEAYGQAIGTSTNGTPNNPDDDFLFLGNGTSNIYSTDFDDPEDPNGPSNIFGQTPALQLPMVSAFEGTTAPGDSGGPLLAMVDGEWVIAGVLSGGRSGFNSRYGDISFWTGVGAPGARDFLIENGGSFQERRIVPLPAAGGLLAVAAAALGLRAGRRRDVELA